MSLLSVQKNCPQRFTYHSPSQFAKIVERSWSSLFQKEYIINIVPLFGPHVLHSKKCNIIDTHIWSLTLAALLSLPP